MFYLKALPLSVTRFFVLLLTFYLLLHRLNTEQVSNSSLVQTGKMWRNLVIDSQSDFRSRGWNNAGANLLALAVGLANRHYLYVRPRLTPRDFGYALAPALPGILIASLISYLAEPAVLPQMAALGCVLGLLGKILV